MNSEIYAVISDGVGLLVIVLGDMASSGQEMRYDKVHMVRYAETSGSSGLRVDRFDPMSWMGTDVSHEGGSPRPVPVKHLKAAICGRSYIPG